MPLYRTRKPIGERVRGVLYILKARMLAQMANLWPVLEFLTLEMSVFFTGTLTPVTIQS